VLKGKKATVILSTGGDFSPGAPFASTNMASNYLRQVLGFIGISDVNIILAVRTLAVDQGHRPLRDYVTELDGEILSAAAA
jgi:FMN-dependent NADH-azoreductase